MSGTPISERWNVLSTGFMPFNRGSLGRTPFLWFVNLYAEYSLKLGPTALNFNINIDNAFDADTATRVYEIRTLYPLEVTEDDLLSKDWDLETSGYIPHPAFKMKWMFYPPITARLGIRFSF